VPIARANAGKTQQIERRRAQVATHLNAGLKQVEIARMLAVSPDTIARDTKALNGLATPEATL